MPSKGYLGFVTLEGSLYVTHQFADNTNLPTEPTTTPTFQIYGGGGPLANGSGTLAQKHTGSVTGASNASPIVITSAGHGLLTGTRVTLLSIGGNTAANTTTTITRIDANNFSLDGTTGNGAYTSGGTWAAAGLYGATYTASAANGFVQGQTYTLIVRATVSSAVRADTYTFTVV